MDNTLVRINRIILTNFKNTRKGIIEMPAFSEKNMFSEHADVLGIYGQNGSGKTSVVEALRFIKKLLKGETLSSDTEQYITQDELECNIEVLFSIFNEKEKMTVTYNVAFKKMKENFVISQEKLAVTPRNEGVRATESVLVDYRFENDEITFFPEYRYKKMVASEKKMRVALNVAQAISIKDHQSFIFGEEGYQLFSNCKNDVMGEFKDVFFYLHKYALANLFIINNEHSGPISMNLLLPMAFYVRNGKHIMTGDLPIRIDEPSLVTEKQFSLAQKVIDSMNIVMKSVIPGMEVKIHDFGEQLLESGTVGHKIELLSSRGDILIPLKYESEGIIKIISFLNILICVYNNPSMCLVIDELDSGVFEYLLGELLSVFSDGGKGQLIFTSHNLRALEMLNKQSILFSTANPENRYIRLQKVQANNNLRDMYLRSLTLGGQKEQMYEETDSVLIGRAFRRSGKAVEGNVES